jgi:hypothetical protein
MGRKESKYLSGLERRRGEELGDLGRELPVQIARADANTTHAVGGVPTGVSRGGFVSPWPPPLLLLAAGVWGFEV